MDLTYRYNSHILSRTRAMLAMRMGAEDAQELIAPHGRLRTGVNPG